MRPGERWSGAKPVPLGYCQCGCGQKTALATRSEPSKGYVIGEPRLYLRGHHLRVPWRERVDR